MRLRIFALACIAGLAGCSKVDKDICWKQETKDSVDALVAAQGDDTTARIKNLFEFKNIEVYFGSVSVDTTTSDYSLDRIDNDSGTADCSARLTVVAKFNAGAKIQNTGTIRFSSKVGEHGRYIDLNKSDIMPVASGLK